AKGYLFPSLEPFGIAPVEALAAGCPVIALACIITGSPTGSMSKNTEVIVSSPYTFP
ncbi:MAG: glycosyltransferase, partial [Firmicutes bacterium]|nr:glycosyltransferase [Bacillota bacterium]